MRGSWVVVLVCALPLIIGCGGLTGLNPTSPTPVVVVAPAVVPPPAAGQGPQVITGMVGPGANNTQSCYFGRPCEVYPFTLTQDGGVDVTLTWQGNERALMIQLYRAGAGLVHEDLAPRGSEPRISFRRTDLEAMDYELRVVNIDNAGATIPFTLSFTRLD